MIRRIFCFVLLGLSGLLGYIYLQQHGRWRDCFDENGRCFDDSTGVVYLAQSGPVWLALTVLAFATAIYLLWKRPSRR